MSDVVLKIEAVVSVDDEAAVCIVRCHGGVAYPQMKLNVMTDGNERVRVNLIISAILRYERPAEILDPPHTAKIILTGEDARVVSRFPYLTREDLSAERDR